MCKAQLYHSLISSQSIENRTTDDRRSMDVELTKLILSQSYFYVKLSSPLVWFFSTDRKVSTVQYGRRGQRAPLPSVTLSLSILDVVSLRVHVRPETGPTRWWPMPRCV
jgi:hypothetical protein